MRISTFFLRARWLLVTFICWGLLVGQVAAVVNPAQVQIITGTYDGGNVASLETVDNDRYHVIELTGSPALDVRVIFTDVIYQAGQSIQVYGQYDGNPAHNLTWFIWNGTAWRAQDRFLSGVPGNFTAIITQDMINDNQVALKFDHIGGGSAGHDLYLDQVILTSMDPITALSWFTFGLWLILAGGAYAFKKPPVLTIGSLYGFYLSWVLYGSDQVASLAFMCVNLYTLWDSFDKWDHD